MKSAEAKSNRLVVPVVLGNLLLILALFLPSSLLPRSGDSALYTYIAQRWAEGDSLYTEVWDVKPPGVFIVYRLAFLAFGQTPLAVPAAEMLALWAASVGIFLPLRERRGLTCAVIAGILEILFYCATSLAGWRLQAEIFALPLLIWAVVLITKENCGRMCAFLGGALVGLACLLKTPFASFLLLWLFIKRPRPSLSLYLLGFAVILVMTGAYFGMVGDLGAFLETQLTFAPAHAAWERPALSALPERFAQEFTGSGAGMLIYPLATVGAVLYLWRHRRLSGITAGWIAVSVLVVVVQSRYWPYHWVMWQAGAAVCLAEAVIYFTRTLRRQWWRIAAAGGLLAGLLYGFPLRSAIVRWVPFYNFVSGQIPYLDYLSSFGVRLGDERIDARIYYLAGQYAKARLQPDETLWVFGPGPAVNVLAERRCPTRFPSTYQFRMDSPLREAWRTEYVEKLRAMPPALAIIPRLHKLPDGEADYLQVLEEWPELRNFFWANYEKEESLGPLEFYRLKARSSNQVVPKRENKRVSAAKRAGARLRTEGWRMGQMIVQRKDPRALGIFREEREKALRRLIGLMGYSQDEAERILRDKAEDRRPKS